MAPNDEITIERLETRAALEPLRAEWNALAGGVPFRGYEWLESWWRHYGGAAGRELLVLTAREADGTLAGIAPWYLEHKSARPGVVRYLGSGEVCSDYLTILCRRGREPAVGRAIARWLDAEQADGTRRGDWDLIELANAYQEDSTIGPLVSQLHARGKLVHRRERSSCWRIHLPRDWEQYLATLSKSHRKQIRRLERHYFDSGRAVVRVAQDEIALERGLNLLADLHQRRRASLGERGCFASPRFAAFHEETARRLLELGSLRLAWLEVDGVAAAVEYQVLGDGVVYAYQSGIEPAALEHEPGRLITLATLKLAIGEGRHAYDFLRGDETYKAHWRAQPRPTQDIRIIKDTPRARLRHNLWLAGGNVKNWIKRGLQASGVLAGAR